MTMDLKTYKRSSTSEKDRTNARSTPSPSQAYNSSRTSHHQSNLRNHPSATAREPLSDVCIGIVQKDVRQGIRQVVRREKLLTSAPRFNLVSHGEKGPQPLSQR